MSVLRVEVGDRVRFWGDVTGEVYQIRSDSHNVELIDINVDPVHLVPNNYAVTRLVEIEEILKYADRLDDCLRSWNEIDPAL